MRTTLWLLPVGLVLAVMGGCASSRLGLAKSDKPTKKPDGIDRVEYTPNPWKKKKEEPVEPKELPPELAKLKQKRLEAKGQPTDVTPWLKNAAVAESKGELGAAKELYKKILDKDPNNAESHHRLAVIADQQKDPQTADVHYQTALKLNRRDADLLSDMGYSLFLRGKYDESETRLKEALEANLYHRGAHSNLGLVYGKQGKYDQALAAFRQAGTESDAQRNMAQLFPNGRPGSNGGQPNGSNLAGNVNRAAPAMPDNIDLAGASIEDVRQRMQQEREAAIRARQSQQQQEFRPDLEQLPPTVNRGNAPAPNGFANAAPAPNPNPAWPPVTPMPPTTFNQGTMNPGGTNSAVAMNTAPSATNVAKPADGSPFWTPGGLSNNPPATNTNSGFAQNMSPPPNSMGNFASPGTMSPRNTPPNGDPSAPWTGSDFASAGGQTHNFANMSNGVQPAGFSDFAQPNGFAPSGSGTMNDASRMAAQFAMATGPGGLLPVVTPSRGAAGQSSNGVNHAYGETNGPPNRNVDHAVWSQQPGADRGVPATNTSNTNPAPFGSAAPPQPWSDWQSPAPATINWNDSATNVNGTPPAWNPNQPAPSNSNATIPAWGANPNNEATAPSGNPNNPQHWDDFNATAPANPSYRGGMSGNSNEGTTTYPSWPHSPSRP